MATYNNNSSNAMNYYGNGYQTSYGMSQQGYYSPQPQQGYYSVSPQPQVNPYQPVYVHGIEGANAYQLPPGLNRQILWDDTDDCFYVKGYDNTGRPRVEAWNDYAPHQEKQEDSKVNMSSYVTKDELSEILAEFNKAAYVTRNELNLALSKLRIFDDENGKERDKQ